jgi:hypothetical protein
VSSRSSHVHRASQGGIHHRKLDESSQGIELLRAYLNEVLTERTVHADDDFDFVVDKQLKKLGLRLADIDEPGQKETVEFEGDIYQVYVVPREKSNAKRRYTT